MRLASTPVVELQRQLRDEVRQHYPAGRIVLGVDGIDGAGKTTFADGFAEVFAEADVAVFRASLDDFLRPRAERYAHGRDSAVGFYRDTYDIPTFRRVLLDPFRDGARTSGATGFQLAAFDHRRDAPVEARWTTGPADAVLIVDGMFLQSPETQGIWNWTVWLEAPFAVAYARVSERDGTDPDPDAPANARYRGGQEIYLREARPSAAASAIVDNTDPARPLRAYRDFC